MIISHRHNYLFIEIPLTGSWSIRNELRDLYDGTSILHKHATFRDFQQQASEYEKGYFAFATVRNPLDSLVSRYFKLMTDHKGIFSNPNAIGSLESDYADQRKHRTLKGGNISFQTAFVRYWNSPYSNLIDLSSQSLSYVIRFENIQAGFSEVLRILGIPQVRPLPHVNKTAGKLLDWSSYYSPEIAELAKKTCGPFMQEWDYSFPESWGAYRPTRLDKLRYKIVRNLRSAYLEHLRYSGGFIAKSIRVLRSRVQN